MKLRRARSWMASKMRVVFLIMFISLLNLSALFSAVALSDSVETAALLAFKKAQPDPDGKLSSWIGNNPCGPPEWQGIYCDVADRTTNVSHVIEIRAMNYNLRGTLVPELGNLSRLLRLNVMNTGLTGTIPSDLGKLRNLRLFLVNDNRLEGSLPPELGGLTNMTRFQVDANRLSGPIPAEFGNLTSVRHLHMNNNSFSDVIPPDLGRLGRLNHLILDHNPIRGPLPVALANAPALTIIQLDDNPIGSSLPVAWARIPTLIKLSLRNCSITDTVPNIQDMSNLTFIDMSYNNLRGSLPTNISSQMITLGFSNNRLNGIIPPEYAALDYIQNLDVSNNNLEGSIPAFGAGKSFTNDSQIVVLDLQNNNFSGWDVKTVELTSHSNKTIWLDGNDVFCGNNSNYITAQVQRRVCTGSDPLAYWDSPLLFATGCTSCDSPAVAVNRGLSPNMTCGCAVPITVKIRLKSPSFTYFDASYISYIEGLTARALSISQYQVVLSAATRVSQLYSQDITLLVFPAVASTFTQTEYDNIFFQFASWNVSAGEEWSVSFAGPYDFMDLFRGVGSAKKNGLGTGVVVGIVVGAVAVASALAALLTFLLLRRRSKYSNRNNSKLYGGMMLPPGIKIQGVKGFTFEDVSRATNNFNPDNELGQGGYGKVYKGVLPDGIPVAIKRAEEGSMQNAVQFYTEIELLSRVHHRNLVSLLGYCNDRGEQMLVYEFMAGGTLRDHLTPTEIMGFARRLHIALGTARGILYLHTEADPPIFHRDIKASNILLDERYNAKVADFGLSKLAPMPDPNGATPQHVSTIVKGTPGYLDPEYFLTQKLTDKTDVYSFGIVLLELITGMFPIAYGKNIVREVNRAMEEGDIMSIADPQMGTFPSKQGLEPLLKLALACCQNESDARPRMVDIVRELEDIWRINKLKVSDSWKEDPDTFSIELGHRKAHSSGEPSSNSWQDMSCDMKASLKGKIDPR